MSIRTVKQLPAIEPPQRTAGTMYIGVGLGEELIESDAGVDGSF